MKVHAEYSEPEQVKDRQPYRIRIEGRRSGTIEIVEQMNGGFAIIASMRSLVIEPLTQGSIVVRVK